jgi:hypothetical protein
MLLEGEVPIDAAKLRGRERSFAALEPDDEDREAAAAAGLHQPRPAERSARRLN